MTNTPKDTKILIINGYPQNINDPSYSDSLSPDNELKISLTSLRNFYSSNKTTCTKTSIQNNIEIYDCSSIILDKLNDTNKIGDNDLPITLTYRTDFPTTHSVREYNNNETGDKQVRLLNVSPDPTKQNSWLLDNNSKRPNQAPCGGLTYDKTPFNYMPPLTNNLLIGWGAAYFNLLNSLNANLVLKPKQIISKSTTTTYSTDNTTITITSAVITDKADHCNILITGTGANIDEYLNTDRSNTDDIFRFKLIMWKNQNSVFDWTKQTQLGNHDVFEFDLQEHSRDIVNDTFHLSLNLYDKNDETGSGIYPSGWFPSAVFNHATTSLKSFQNYTTYEGKPYDLLKTMTHCAIIATRHYYIKSQYTTCPSNACASDKVLELQNGVIVSDKIGITDSNSSNGKISYDTKHSFGGATCANTYNMKIGRLNALWQNESGKTGLYSMNSISGISSCDNTGYSKPCWGIISLNTEYPIPSDDGANIWTVGNGSAHLCDGSRMLPLRRGKYVPYRFVLDNGNVCRNIIEPIIGSEIVSITQA
jgi:hypothetical protein